MSPKRAAWKRYPNQKPEECTFNIIIYRPNRKDDKIISHCFYRAEDAAHDHSVWQGSPVYWIEERELINLPIAKDIYNKKEKKHED